MNETPAANAPELDPLATPASAVDISMPKLMPDKLYNMEVAEATSKTNDNGVGMVKIKLKTIKDELSDDSTTLNAGFPVFENWVYTPTGGLTAENIRRQGATILRACGLGSATLRELADNPSIIVGKVVTVKVRTRKAEGSFPASSVVGQWVEVKG